MIKLDIGAAPLGAVPGLGVTLRVLFLGLLILIMLIPLAMIGDLVTERQVRRMEVESGIANLWGHEQIIGGPVLTVPYLVRAQTRASDGTITEQESQRLAYFLPSRLDIDADVATETRYKSIYEVLVYGAEVTMTGRIDSAAFAEWNVAPADILWSEATIALGVADIAGIREIGLELDGRPVALSPGLPKTALFAAGLQGRLPAASGAPTAAREFKLRLALKGSRELAFLPFGSETTIAMRSNWPHPNFTGAALPETRTIAGDGFRAGWALSYLARPYPQAWREGDLRFSDLPDGRIGVAFMQPGDSYQQTDRIVKYGVLVIALTFATIFVVGLVRATRAHTVQYLLVAASICIFYLLVLSLSEHVRFATAYGIASAVDVATVALYVWRTVARLAGYVVAATLGLVHGWMYVLLQMEDYVLLSGSIGLLLALIAVMYATRNIDWFRIGLLPRDGAASPAPTPSA
jgi:inner membrane protein